MPRTILPHPARPRALARRLVTPRCLLLPLVAACGDGATGPGGGSPVGVYRWATLDGRPRPAVDVVDSTTFPGTTWRTTVLSGSLPVRDGGTVEVRSRREEMWTDPVARDTVDFTNTGTWTLAGQDFTMRFPARGAGDEPSTIVGRWEGRAIRFSIDGDDVEFRR